VPQVVAGHPHVTGAQYMAKYNVKGSGAQPAARNLWSFLSANVERRDIEVTTGAPAKELLKNQKGEVTGVIAEIEGKNILIKARKAVILTCGGFENNPVLRREYLPVKDVPFLGNPGNSGDGIDMVQKAGAALWHMTAMVSGIGLKVPEYEVAFFISFYSPKFIIVDKYGRRYFDEVKGVEPHEYWRPFSYFDAHRLEYPRMPSYAIFDEDARRRGPIIMAGKSGSCHDLYQWSEDNSAEIKKGWIIRAKTIREISKRLALDEATLENTLARYNEYCRAGEDLDFGRPRQDLSPIEPPYYAVELWPAIANTQGGPRRDKEARVLDPYGKPIPGLYAAGEFGSIWGFMYPGGCNLSECIVFGQIAGRNAANDREVEP
jgi:succinate dehydrogenase/fumarate reductase flavoprotein subunit